MGVGLPAYPSRTDSARISSWAFEHFPAVWACHRQWHLLLEAYAPKCYGGFRFPMVSVLHALECLSIIMILLTFKRSCIVLSQTKDAKLLSPSWHPTESTSKTLNDKIEHNKTRKEETNQRCEIICFEL